MAEGRISKKVKQGKIDIDFEDSALLVNCDIETVQQDENGRVLAVLDRKSEVRRIKIKSLSADKNMAQLAADIIDKCKYIHPSRTEEVEQLLIKLRKYSLANPVSKQSETQNHDEDLRKKNGQNEVNVPRNKSSPENLDSYQDSRNGHGRRDSSGRQNNNDNSTNEAPSRPPPSKSALDMLPPARMDELEDYQDMLYQVAGKSEKEREAGLAMQVRGTAMILKLCRDVMNLEQLIQNPTVMGALTRVLQEEFKKSVDLTFNILRIFLAFSNFMEMHSIMVDNYRIGGLTMKAIEFEMRRSEAREEEKAEREAAYKQEMASAKEKQSQLSSQEYSALVDRLRKDREREQQKQKQLVRKQDKLLFVGFYILLNLAEDLSVERKMIKKSLISSLAAMLCRSFEDLLILCVTFLKKLSTIEENKEAIKDCGVVNLLARFIPCSSQPLVTISLRFLFNLSFDKDLREQLIKCGYVPKLINLLKTPMFRAKTLKLLYHLSVDERCKSMFGYHPEGMTILVGMVINFPQDVLAKELGALVINLSCHARNVELMLANKGLNLLMDRLADKGRDILLVKIIRNISQWSFNQQMETDTPELDYKYRGLWSPHLKQLLEMTREVDNQDMLLEVLGILANMTIYDLPATATWAKLLKEFNLISLFSRLLVPGMAQNDLLLEVVMLISSIASDLQACAVIAASTLIGLLYQLWKDKCEDVEILLQLLNCFHRLFCHKEAREEAMYSTRVVVDIIDCLSHRNSAVRAAAEKLCDIVLEFDRKISGEPGQLGKEIIKKRFESYNRVWLVNNNIGGTDKVGTITNYMGGSDDRLRSSFDEEVNMHNSAQRFDDTVDNSLDWHGRTGTSQFQGSKADYYSQSTYQQMSNDHRQDESEEDSGSYNHMRFK